MAVPVLTWACLAATGCGTAPDATVPPTSSPASAAADALRPLASTVLVPGPVRDRLDRADGSSVLARGAETWILRPSATATATTSPPEPADGTAPAVRRVAAGSPAPIVALARHRGRVHAAGRDGRVWRLEEAAGGPRLVALPMPPALHDAAGDRAGPIAGLADARTVGLVSLGGSLHLVHGGRVLTWGDPIAPPVVTPLPDGVVDPHVVPGDAGPLIAAGRRVVTARGGDFVGSASRLRAAPAGADWPGRLLFARTDVDGRGAEVGAMDGRLRELDRTRLRLRLDGPVTGLAFHDGRPVVETPGQVRRLAVRDGRLIVSATVALAPGERLWAAGPDEAAILGRDGRRRPLPGEPPRADPVAALLADAAAPRLPRPRAATFDGRTLRVWTSAGVHEVGPAGRVRARPDVDGPAVDAIRVRPVVTTRRGTLAVPPDGGPGLLAGAAARAATGTATAPPAAGEAPPGANAAAPALPHVGRVSGLAAIDGLAWAGVEGGLLLVDPDGPRVLGRIPVDGRPTWIALARGGRDTIVLTDAGEVRRVPRPEVD